jgi:hypothetical protein
VPLNGHRPQAPDERSSFKSYNRPGANWLVKKMALASAELNRIAERYRAFAIDEVRGISETYESLSLGIAASPEVLAFIASVPADRRQPNLFLAAVRQICGVPENTTHLTSLLRKEHERIRSVMLSRTTQTNEPARCSVLLPVLAQLPQPLALLEVGASAGLCLLPDRYGYHYGVKRIAAAIENAPIFHCAVSGALPLPDTVPQVVWRLGLDLNPIDLFSDGLVEWLELLVWPARKTVLKSCALRSMWPAPIRRGSSKATC